MRVRLLVLFLISASLVGCDHATKAVALSQFRDEPLRLLSGALTLTYTENRDMAFGLLGYVLDAPSRLWVLTAAKAAAVLFGAGFLLLRHDRASWRELLAVALMVAGAAGNLIDRVARGYVIDFLRVPHWPVFNVADIAICVGAGLLLLTMLTGSTRPTSPLSRDAH
jgi:signal peptidase II